MPINTWSSLHPCCDEGTTERPGVYDPISKHHNFSNDRNLQSPLDARNMIGLQR